MSPRETRSSKRKLIISHNPLLCEHDDSLCIFRKGSRGLVYNWHRNLLLLPNISVELEKFFEYTVVEGCVALMHRVIKLHEMNG